MDTQPPGVKKLEFNEKLFEELFKKRGYVARYKFLDNKPIAFRFSVRYPTEARTIAGRIVLVFEDKPVEMWPLYKVIYVGRTLGFYGPYFFFPCPIGRVYFMVDISEEFAVGFAYTIKGILELVILEAGIDWKKLKGVVVDVLVLPKGWKP
jgi:hypothetical protein